MTIALSTLSPLIHIPRCPEPLKIQALRTACRQFCRETEWLRKEVTADWLGVSKKVTLTVSGAGSSVVNGNYLQSSSGGSVYYLSGNSDISISISGGEWVIRSTPFPSTTYYSNANISVTPDLAGTWTVEAGSGPAPTVSLFTNRLNDDYDDTQIIRVRWVKADDRCKHESLWSVSSDGVLTFDPVLTTEDVIAAEIALMPTITANSVDADLVSRFGEALAYGAEFHLKSQKGSELDPIPWYDPEGAALARNEFQGGVSLAKMEVYSSRQSGEKQVDLMGGIW